MKITNFFKAMAVSFIIALAIPVTSNAMHNSNVSTPLSDSAADVKLAAHIIQRVTEIQNMDKTNLTTAERKSLKKELKEMQAQASSNQGVYLSIGAIVIILLILILIL
ncbi:hypothetical protein LK994_06990 [Ferruginibacter lapsinanis]|uniref:hypothetical protein n=1 Tax=Ferruginibacter lapsinanis TaxID=563172 RepID=UPI001E365AE7|nr:hypothetical protein [Ferruginibacter lapsinanis]UEG51217.1 hypothetical protein LK994_06990 [Ferruginibacter lapsinanis]